MDVLAVSKDINLNKYKNALLYFINNANNKYLGSTKLNKLMYYLDFVSFRDRGHSVSGDIYLHLDYGPVPQEVDKVLATLKKEGKVSAVDVPFKDGHKDEFKPDAEPDTKAFDKYELSLLEAISKEFELWDTKKIVEQTHLEAPWFYSEPLEVVDYEYASDIDFFAGLLNARANN
jgi:uncharacterized phage-associated protein